jgi:hypothetical protein
MLKNNFKHISNNIEKGQMTQLRKEAYNKIIRT